MRTPLRSPLRTILIAAVAGAVCVVMLPVQAHAATPTHKIAVLGDSWASGEGNTPYTAASAADGCDQSTTAWAYKTVLPTGSTVSSAQRAGTASVQFLACSGAQTKNLIDTSFKGHAPQVGQMSTSTNLVYLSISGNDLDFVGLITECALYGADTCQKGIDRTRSTLMPHALAGLRTILANIRTRTPHAQVLVTGYAPLVGPSAAFFAATHTMLKDFALEYNTAERLAVDAFRTTSFNVKFVSLLPSFLTHADGDTAGAWLFPVTGGVKSGHPNSTGTTQIAKLVTPLVLLPYGTCPTNIKKGMTGICVKEVQTHLNRYGYGLTVDGAFGSNTDAAVRAFQRRVGLTDDGIVGPQTKLKLFLL